MVQGSTILGRTEGDAELIFPIRTNASAACVRDVVVNGKTLLIWEYAQLESLSPDVLRQRVLSIQEAVGAENCMPMLSKQTSDVIRWILRMQCELTGDTVEVRRNAAGIPQWLAQEDARRPLCTGALRRNPSCLMPFGRKLTSPHDLDAARDHYGDMVHRKREFAGEQVLGIESQRVGGSGRRHLQPSTHMECHGISSSCPLGIETLRECGEGRRHIWPKDTLQEQAVENDALLKGEAAVPTPSAPRRRRAENDTFLGRGVRSLMHSSRADVQAQEVSLFDRKRHIECVDHMVNDGTADSETWDNPGRKNQDAFSRHNLARSRGRASEYLTTWKQDPSRLLGRKL